MYVPSQMCVYVYCYCCCTKRTKLFPPIPIVYISHAFVPRVRMKKMSFHDSHLCLVFVSICLPAAVSLRCEISSLAYYLLISWYTPTAINRSMRYCDWKHLCFHAANILYLFYVLQMPTRLQ